MDGQRSRFDIVKQILMIMVKVIIVIVWWFMMLMLASVFLVNVWHTSLIEIVVYTCVLSLATCIIYGIVVLKRRRRI